MLFCEWFCVWLLIAVWFCCKVSGCGCVYLVILLCIRVVSLDMVLVMVLQAGFECFFASRSDLVACVSPCLPAGKVRQASQHVYASLFFFLVGVLGMGNRVGW